eukprot:4209401-Amphidinium_carterae.1
MSDRFEAAVVRALVQSAEREDTGEFDWIRDEGEFIGPDLEYATTVRGARRLHRSIHGMVEQRGSTHPRGLDSYLALELYGSCPLQGRCRCAQYLGQPLDHGRAVDYSGLSADGHVQVLTDCTRECWRDNILFTARYIRNRAPPRNYTIGGHRKDGTQGDTVSAMLADINAEVRALATQHSNQSQMMMSSLDRAQLLITDLLGRPTQAAQTVVGEDSQCAPVVAQADHTGESSAESTGGTGGDIYDSESRGNHTQQKHDAVYVCPRWCGEDIERGINSCGSKV